MVSKIVFVVQILILGVYLNCNKINGQEKQSKIDILSTLNKIDPETATVLVIVKGTGSGVLLPSKDGTLVLTCKHVCPAEGPVNIRHMGKIYPATWLRASKKYDLALLKVSNKLPSLLLAIDEPAAGSKVRTFGYGGLNKLGKVIGPDGSHYPGIGDAWYTTLQPETGDSGAPLIDVDGNVCGIVRGNHVPTGRGMIVRLSHIKEFIDE